jgi:hypothetical protein
MAVKALSARIVWQFKLAKSKRAMQKSARARRINHKPGVKLHPPSVPLTFKRNHLALIAKSL